MKLKNSWFNQNDDLLAIFTQFLCVTVKCFFATPFFPLPSLFLANFHNTYLLYITNISRILLFIRISAYTFRLTNTSILFTIRYDYKVKIRLILKLNAFPYHLPPQSQDYYQTPFEVTFICLIKMLSFKFKFLHTKSLNLA